MVYQQCGPSCPQTCEDTDCSGGCVEGCFCPSGQVLSNGKCIDMNDCAGKYENHRNHIVNDKIKLQSLCCTKLQTLTINNIPNVDWLLLQLFNVVFQSSFEIMHCVILYLNYL